MAVEIITRKPTIEMGTGVIQVPTEYPIYTGETTVTPITTSNITLETERTAVLEDISVLKIPYEEVSNPQGGLTATIGEY